MIQYVKGDATCPIGEGQKIIAHICNDIGGWGRGFVLSLSAKWPEPEAAYKEWFLTNKPVPFELGQVIFAPVEPEITVANMIGQRHIKPLNGLQPIRYDAVRSALEKVSDFAMTKNATVHMPRIGCGLAGGSWDQMRLIIMDVLVDEGIEVFVYDL
jgi:O-acetyl-ADP-ribose deacetylase (regulator of RNase III)